jgi:cytochrome c peroxidase
MHGIQAWTSTVYSNWRTLYVLKKYPSVSSSIVAMAFVGACAEPAPELNSKPQELLEEFVDQIPNNLPILNSSGLAASFHPAGSVDLNNAFFTPQGTNGRDCGTCHTPEDGWSIRPSTVTALFLWTGGTHPIFVNNLDTDTPTSDMSTVQARWNATTMLRQGKFTRKVAPPAVRDYEVIAASDPFGVGTTASLWFFRRPLPTANFRSFTTMWDGANTVGTVLRDGLIKQARGNVTGAQQGAPASDEVIFGIVDYEMAISNAQLVATSVGRLDAGGAHGGPEAASAQPLVDGRFDLYDAWAQAGNPRRKQIWRGQELFNGINASGRSCRGCHNAANNGQNVNGTLFDVGVSRPEFANADMAVYTFRRTSDGATLQSTDPGRGIRSGKFADLNRFKTPNLRGLAARAPYFHNGIAATLEDVVRHYESALGFVFTDDERRDLAAFLSAL